MKALNIDGVARSAERKSRPAALLDEIRAVLQNHYKIELPTMPDVPPQLDQYGNIDMMTGQQLGALHAQFVGYASNIGHCVAEARIYENAAKRALDEYRARKHLELSTDNEVAKSDLAATIKATDEYQELDTEYFRANAVRVLLEARKEAFDDSAAAVSRMITIWTTEYEAQHRDHSVGNRRFQARPHTPAPTSFRPGAAVQRDPPAAAPQRTVVKGPTKTVVKTVVKPGRR